MLYHRYDPSHYSIATQYIHCDIGLHIKTNKIKIGTLRCTLTTLLLQYTYSFLIFSLLYFKSNFSKINYLSLHNLYRYLIKIET